MHNYKNIYFLLLNLILLCYFNVACSQKSHLKEKELKTNQVQTLKQSIECPPHLHKIIDDININNKNISESNNKNK
ncbi:MAG: hypothetical protein U1E31_01285 [Rickettsiales bacterium]